MLQCNRYPGLDANEIIRLTSAIGHNLPVRVTFQFLLVVCSVIELNGRYSASKLMTSLPQPGHDPPLGIFLHCGHSFSHSLGH